MGKPTGKAVPALGPGGRWAAVRRHRAAYLFLAPFTIVFFLFTALPMISAVGLSFTNFNMLQWPRIIGLSNYVRLLFADDVFLIALRNTFLFALLTGPVGFAVSLLLAWLINELKPGMRALLVTVFYAPTMAGNVFFIWKIIFSGDAYGLVNGFLMSLGVLNEPVQWLYDSRYNLWIVVLVVLWLSLGVGFLAFVAGMQTVNRDLYESAAIDGIHNRWQELWYVTLPQIMPQLTFAAVIVLSASFAVGYQSAELTGFPSTDYSAHTLVLHILDYGYTRFEMGYASAISVALFFIMLFFWNLINRIFQKLGGDA